MSCLISMLTKPSPHFPQEETAAHPAGGAASGGPVVAYRAGALRPLPR